MAWPGTRYACAALLAGLLAVYATMFAYSTFDLFDLPLGLGLLEWPVTIIFAYVVWGAWNRQSRKAAIAAVLGMLGFYTVHGHMLFHVPIAFIVVTVLTLIVVTTLPSAWAAGW